MPVGWYCFATYMPKMLGIFIPLPRSPPISLSFSPYHFFILDTDSHETRWKGRFAKRIQHPLWSVSNPDHTARNPVGHKNYGKYLVWLSSCFNGSILNSKTRVSCLNVQGQQQLRNSPGLPMSCWFRHFRVFVPPPCSVWHLDTPRPVTCTFLAVFDKRVPYMIAN